MSSIEAQRARSPFPVVRPEITITPSQEPLFEVDWRELAWWFAVPEVGDHTMWAVYDPPEWRLTSWQDMKTVMSAVVNGIDGVEIDIVDREIGEVEQVHPWTFYARLTEDKVQYLAVVSVQNGKRRVCTLLDEGFDVDWYESQRLVKYTGRFIEQIGGSYKQCSDCLITGERAEVMGVYEVSIGSRSFTCLRVLDVEHTFSENSLLMEGYLTREGRTVLCRRYNGRLWRGGSKAKLPWDEEFPDHNRIIIDGVTFVHWYDCLSDFACGIDPDSV